MNARILRATDKILGRPHEFIKGNMRRRKNRRFRFYETIKERELAIEIDIMYSLLHECLLVITTPLDGQQDTLCSMGKER